MPLRSSSSSWDTLYSLTMSDFRILGYRYFEQKQLHLVSPTRKAWVFSLKQFRISLMRISNEQR